VVEGAGLATRVVARVVVIVVFAVPVSWTTLRGLPRCRVDGAETGGGGGGADVGSDSVMMTLRGRPRPRPFRATGFGVAVSSSWSSSSSLSSARARFFDAVAVAAAAVIVVVIVVDLVTDVVDVIVAFARAVLALVGAVAVEARLGGAAVAGSETFAARARVILFVGFCGDGRTITGRLSCLCDAKGEGG